MSVLCVRQGDKFGPAYVSMLARMAEDHAGTGVVCLTDRENTPGRIRRLTQNFQGWWAKLELFAPWNEDLRPALYLDLDTYILGDIRDIVSHETSGLTMLRDFNRRERAESGVMLIPKDTARIWENWDRGMMGMGRSYGDGPALAPFNTAFLQDIFPGIVSYKVDDCRAEPKGRLLCFHGRPKPHETEGWARKVYNRHEA